MSHLYAVKAVEQAERQAILMALRAAGCLHSEILDDEVNGTSLFRISLLDAEKLSEINGICLLSEVPAAGPIEAFAGDAPSIDSGSHPAAADAAGKAADATPAIPASAPARVILAFRASLTLESTHRTNPAWKQCFPSELLAQSKTLNANLPPAPHEKLKPEWRERYEELFTNRLMPLNSLEMDLYAEIDRLILLRKQVTEWCELYRKALSTFMSNPNYYINSK